MVPGFCIAFAGIALVGCALAAHLIVLLAKNRAAAQLLCDAQSAGESAFKN
jgi:hypothetical protein